MLFSLHQIFCKVSSRRILCRKLARELLYDIVKKKIWSNSIDKVVMHATGQYLVDVGGRSGHQPQHENQTFEDIFLLVMAKASSNNKCTY